MKWPRLKPPPVWHPLLVALAPVLAAFADNVHEVAARELVGPVALTAGLTLASWAVLARAWHDARKSAVVVSAVALLFFNFGAADAYVQGLTGGWSRQAPFLTSAVALLAGAALLAVALRAALRRAALVRLLTGVLNGFSALLVAVLLAHLVLEGAAPALGGLDPAPAPGQARPGEGGGPQAGPVPETAAHPGRMPDIYYIVLDAYGRGDVLRDIYGFDNREFLDGLRAKGFYVAGRSTSNYCRTPLSLASSLNGRYHTGLAETDAPLQVLAAAIRDCSVFRTLKRHGYRLVCFRTGFPFTDLPDADVYLAPPSPARAGSDFPSLLAEKTPLRLYWEGRHYLAPPGEAASRDGYDERRQLVRYVLGGLGAAARQPSPKFVFAHVVCPHPPFVFGEDGEDTSPHQIPFAEMDGTFYRAQYGWASDYVRGYGRQARFVTRLAEQAVEDILRNSPEPPVIVLQGDHGPGSRWDCASADPGRSDVTERLGILNAYYLPGGGDKGLYEGITPVNTFRLILTNYFGARLDPLPDRNYFSSVKQAFHFVDVTDRVR